MTALVASARCHNPSCGWAQEGDPAAVDKSAAKHVASAHHAVSTVTRNPDAPVRQREAS